MKTRCRLDVFALAAVATALPLGISFVRFLMKNNSRHSLPARKLLPHLVHHGGRGGRRLAVRATVATLVAGLAVVSCGEVYEGMPTDIVLLAPPLPASVERFDIVVSEVEVLACESDLWASFPPLVSVAWAHSDSTPVMLGTPYVISFGSDAVTLGTLALPPNCYEGVRVLISAADDDAIGLDHAPEMLGLSALLDTVRGEDAARSSATAELTFRWPDPVEIEAVAGRADTLQLTLALDDGWSDAPPGEQARQALAQLHVRAADWETALTP